jgi:hypothetical protein
MLRGKSNATSATSLHQLGPHPRRLHPPCLAQMVRELVPHLQAIAQEGSAFPVNIRRHSLSILHHLVSTLSGLRGAFQKEVGGWGWAGLGLGLGL